MTVVYLDSLFLLNLGLDGMLLSAARKLSRSGGSRLRTLLAAVLGAAYAGAVFCLPSPALTHPLTRLGVAVVMAWLAAGGLHKTGPLLLLFLLLTCSLAGGVLLMEAAGVGAMSSGSGFPVTVSDGKLLLLCAAGEYLLAAGAARLTRRRGAETAPVLLSCEGRKVLLRALVDSGNLLRDPLTGKPVLVVSAHAGAGLFPPGCAPDREALRRPEQCFADLASRWTPSRLRLVPFRAVGTGQGLLLAVRVDQLEVGGTVYRNRLAAVTAENFSGAYQGIIGTEEGGIA